MKPFFFIDYDNTIFDHRTGSIPESAIRAMKEIQEAGCKLIVASGRSLERLRNQKAFKDKLYPDCIIGSNGAAVEAEGRLIWENYFDLELQGRLMDFVLKKGYCMTFNLNGQRCISNVSHWKERRLDEHTGTEAEKMFLKLYHKAVPSFFLTEDQEAQHDVQEHFPEIKVLSMGDHTSGADVIPRENGKVMGAERILNYYQAAWENTVAIGDSMNDIELIRKAALGIAMGNAMRTVRESADYVTSDIGENGLSGAIAYAFQWFGKNKKCGS